MADSGRRSGRLGVSSSASSSNGAGVASSSSRTQPLGGASFVAVAAAAAAARITAPRGVKRALAVIQDGIKGSAEEVVSDYLCPICLDLINEAHIISCGHTFCRVCLEKSIESNKRCPKCNFTVFNMDSIFPNHLVNKQVLKYKKSLELKETINRKNKSSVLSELKSYICQDAKSLEITDLTSMITLLQEKKAQMLSESDETKYKLLKTFLLELKIKKEQQLLSINSELAIVNFDLESVTKCLADVKSGVKEEALFTDNFDIGVPNCSNISVNEVVEGDTAGSSTSNQDVADDQAVEGFNVPVDGDSSASITSLNSKRKKVHLHFEELSESYFSHRDPVLTDITDEEHTGSTSVDSNLNRFGECVCKFSQFTRMRPLATIDYAGDKFPASSNIASSIEFDKDGEFFAVAGLTKKIRIFDYGNVIRDVVDLHYPCAEMVCDSKISCVSWSSYLKNKLASSDYDGDVTIWDAFTTQKLHVYKEHQKRCWSVDFNKMDTKLLASGSDDACVKLWHLDSERSLTNLEAKANVCCVQFNPESRYHLAFGSADHCVHYYDLRNLKESLKVFKGHRKAVSYVKFISGEEIVSASTDSQLKVWNVNKSDCVQSLRGHINDKNFVGLATDGEYVACGSENNSLYVFYKGLPKKILSFRFDQRRFILDPEPREEDTTDFVSAVCWRKGSNVLVTGNSQGIIKVLQMV
uniref:E3 ubiquitin-protein ligase RFWD2-like n=1 Tax=Hirondellea gigas TaxID=1518452 RepID=A0A2P2I6F2_9CRUS